MKYKLVSEDFAPKFVGVDDAGTNADICFKSVFRNISAYPMVVIISDDMTVLQDKINSTAKKAIDETFIAPRSSKEYLWPHIYNIDPNKKVDGAIKFRASYGKVGETRRFPLRREVKLELMFIKGDKKNPKGTHQFKWFDLLTAYGEA
jgi:hypothetical protein